MSEGPGPMAEERVRNRMLMASAKRNAEAVVEQARRQEWRLRVTLVLLVCALMGTTVALGAVAELPPAGPESNGWYRILAGGSAQAVLAVALLVVVGALAVVSRLLYRVQSDRLTEVKSILQDCVLKANETMQRHTEILERVEKKL